MRRQNGLRALTLALLALGAIGLVACGQTTSSGPGGESQKSHEATGTVSSATPSGTAQTSSNTVGAPTPGQVTVSLVGQTNAAQTMAASQSITVQIANGLSSTIITTDHHTDCTMVTLQQQVNGAWQPVGKCLIMAATRMIPIAGGQSVKQVLTPQNGMTGRAWAAGTYRVAFGYSVGSATETPGSGAMVYSATFTIG